MATEQAHRAPDGDHHPDGRGRLGQKIVIITGGAYGIERGSTLVFAREGAKLVLVDLNEEGGLETEALVHAAGGDAHFVPADIGEPADAERVASEAVARYGGVDVLFNNAGIMPEGTTLTHDEGDWDRVMRVNLKGAFLLSRAVIPHMIERGGGSIINTASVQGLRGHQDRLAYVASKHGVIGLTRAMAADHAREGIRVNAVCPGTIDTPMLHRVLDTMPDRQAALRHYRGASPAGVHRDAGGRGPRRALPRLRRGALRNRDRAACGRRLHQLDHVVVTAVRCRCRPNVGPPTSTVIACLITPAPRLRRQPASGSFAPRRWDSCPSGRSHPPSGVRNLKRRPPFVPSRRSRWL